MTSFGVPIQQMKSFLALEPDKRDQILPTKGIPCDSLNNQFKSWYEMHVNKTANCALPLKLINQRLIQTLKTLCLHYRKFAKTDTI